ncbi:MAG: DinB family protein [Bacillota bacterium]
MEEKRSQWNNRQTVLRELLSKPARFKEAIDLCLLQHSLVHEARMSGTDDRTFEDDIWEDLDDNMFRTAANSKGRTIAYGIWHSTRIQDITMNILVADKEQIINKDCWLDRINSTITDTGNAMTAEQILDFSRGINMRELREYRMAVGRNTRELIMSFMPEDLKRKVKKEGLQRVIAEKAVLDVKGANWLIDFWGRKNVAGILLMPVTRHLMVHINESLSAKKRGIK